LFDSAVRINVPISKRRIGNVLLRAQMREKREGLKDVGNSPFRNGGIDSKSGIKEDMATRSDLSFVRPRQPRNAIQECGLAGSRSPKKDGDAGRDFDGNVKHKRGNAGTVPLLADSRDEHAGVYFAAHGVHTRRLTA